MKKQHRLESGTYFQMPKAVTEMGLGMKAGWVYTGLARHANNDTGVALVGIAQLARELGVDRRTVERGLTELETVRLIERMNERYNGRQGWNRYQLLPMDGVHHRRTEVAPQSHRDGITVAQNLHNCRTEVAPQSHRINTHINTHGDTTGHTHGDTRAETYESEPMIAANGAETFSEDYEERPVMPAVVPQVFTLPKNFPKTRRRVNG